MRTKPVEIFAAEDFPVSAETFLVQHKPATLGSQQWQVAIGNIGISKKKPATLGSQQWQHWQYWDFNNGSMYDM